MTMIKKWLIDTDIIIDYLRGLPQASSFLEKTMEQSTCLLSVITVAELYAGIRDGKERHLLENFLHVFEIISLNNDIATTGGLYRRDHGKSHNVGLADALIAATATYCDATLASLNKKNFPMLKNIHVPYKK